MALPISKEKAAEWKQTILQQKASGKSICQWCREKRIIPRSFYYWRSKFFPKPINKSSFTELTDNRKPGITIEYRKVCISLDQNFDLTALKQCLAVIRELKC